MRRVLVEFDLSNVDVTAQRRRLEKDLAAAEKELATTTSKLDNDAFLTRAPEGVIEQVRARQLLSYEEVERITARLAN